MLRRHLLVLAVRVDEEVRPRVFQGLPVFEVCYLQPVHEKLIDIYGAVASDPNVLAARRDRDIAAALALNCVPVVRDEPAGGVEHELAVSRVHRPALRRDREKAVPFQAEVEGVPRIDEGRVRKACIGSGNIDIRHRHLVRLDVVVEVGRAECRLYGLEAGSKGVCNVVGNNVELFFVRRLAAERAEDTVQHTRSYAIIVPLL